MAQETIRLSSFLIDHRILNKNNTTGATYGEGTAYPTGPSWFTLGA